MINQKSVTLTAEEFHTLYNISESMDSAEDDVAKADAVANIFTDALEYSLEYGVMPAKRDVTLNVARVIFDYSRRAINTMMEANKHLGELYSAKRQSLEWGDGDE